MLRLHIKMDHPQPRHIDRVCSVLRGGGLVVYPTDTAYGLGADLYSKRSVDRIYQAKGVPRTHPMSVLCSDLSEVANYAVIEDRNYRILRHHMPGPYTFVLPASREVPKILQTNKRTVGIRIPDSPVCIALIRELGHPLISTTVSRNYEGAPAFLNDPDDIVASYGRTIDAFLDGGPLYGEPSSVIDLTGDDPVIIRKGAGDLSWLE